MTDPFLKLFIIIIGYVIVLFILRFLGFGKKQVCENCNNCCPDCSFALKRIQRKKQDKILYHLTLRIYNLKRYRCSECAWEGLKWEEKYRP